MKRKIKFPIFALILLLVFFASAAFAQPYEEFPETTGGRYELVLFTGYGTTTTSYRLTKLPAVVLDTFMGVVWRCDNIEDSNPRWVKTDLGRNAVPLAAKRYVIRVSYTQISANKIPAIVLDIEDAKVWTCPNVLDQGAPWVATDLVKDIKEERRATAPGY